MRISDWSSDVCASDLQQGGGLRHRRVRSAGAGPGDGGLNIRLDSVEIDDGTLIYRDSAAGTEERIEALDATITAASLQGPFENIGRASARETRSHYV